MTTAKKTQSGSFSVAPATTRVREVRRTTCFSTASCAQAGDQPEMFEQAAVRFFSNVKLLVEEVNESEAAFWAEEMCARVERSRPVPAEICRPKAGTQVHKTQPPAVSFEALDLSRGRY